ncbi:MarR family winged helix-turn-helix transcriptional regulator [Salinibacterium sp. SYSU T00001]|uniref:MarR family winged helix-turn-helix transcriptional regulator n=1 Tax=Homoserinimonas sedimenticola TaxID=2986805 RepID=UPI00223576A8|nr:MarR family winged helix-turn-helix transcriptional regulator [Salinibacterium sedimenticola]MCW4385928.1 MarR family winged helix-turn-helix transcriptional regulator [Salinibacterium sedimenticola]
MTSKSSAVSAWESLFRAQVTVMRRLGAEFPSGEISLTEYDVLFNLSRRPEHALRIRDLVDDLLITQPSVSRLVDRLAARGLIEKRPDPKDARGVVVALTDDGFTLFRRVAVAHMTSISGTVGSALDDRELAQLEQLCDKLRSGVQGSRRP